MCSAASAAFSRTDSSSNANDLRIAPALPFAARDGHGTRFRVADAAVASSKILVTVCTDGGTGSLRTVVGGALSGD